MVAQPACADSRVPWRWLSRRPRVLLRRRFFVGAVEDVIANYTPRFKDPNLATLFGNCLPNTVRARRPAIALVAVLIAAVGLWGSWTRQCSSPL